MNITVPVNITAIVRQLPLQEKLRLVRQLERETWAARLGQVVTRIRARRSVRQLSQRDITRIVEDVRTARYARAAARRP